MVTVGRLGEPSLWYWSAYVPSDNDKVGTDVSEKSEGNSGKDMASANELAWSHFWYNDPNEPS